MKELNKKAAECTAIHSAAETKANTYDLVGVNVSQNVDIKQAISTVYSCLCSELIIVFQKQIQELFKDKDFVKKVIKEVANDINKNL